MQKHRDVLQQASRLAVDVALCIAAMLAVYALTGHFTNAVLLATEARHGRGRVAAAAQGIGDGVQ